MSEHIFEAFSLFLTFQNLAIVFVGVLVGTFVGAIPGMTTPMGVALALPFTFTMEPVTGILLLLGIYKGGLYGGSITAILIKAPGTPAASCTVLDGYPMTQKGEARRALDMALYASCFADFVSNLSLIFLAGRVRAQVRPSGVFHTDHFFPDNHCRGFRGTLGQRRGLGVFWVAVRHNRTGFGIWYQPIHIRQLESSGRLEFHSGADRSVRATRNI